MDGRGTGAGAGGASSRVRRRRNESPAPFASFEERKEKMGFEAYDATQAKLAWGRLVEFFHAHLDVK